MTNCRRVGCGIRVGVLVCLIAGGATTASAAEVSLRYSNFVLAEGVRGWQASVRPDWDKDGTWVVDGAGHYCACGLRLHVLAAGPRATARVGEGETRLFAQLLAGGALLAYVDRSAASAVALPGAGVDLAADSRLGLRLQVDWPFVIRRSVTSTLPRLSVGIVLRTAGPRRVNP